MPLATDHPSASSVEMNSGFLELRRRSVKTVPRSVMMMNCVCYASLLLISNLMRAGKNLRFFRKEIRFLGFFRF